MYLIDTNVISELRKKAKANVGVQEFFKNAASNNADLYLPSIVIGELRRGVELLKYRSDFEQAKQLEKWLSKLLKVYSEKIIDFGSDAAQVWGRLLTPNNQNAINKQLAAISLVHGLCVVTRNVMHFEGTGAEVLNPFLN